MLKSKYSLPNKGFLPVVIILALSLVSVLSVAVFLAFKGEDSSVPDNSVATEQSTNAFQAANSGSEAVLKKIYKEDDAADLTALAEATNSECSEGVISGSTSVGSYKVSLYDATGDQIKNCSDNTWRGQVAKLKSDGISGDTTRVIDVAVAAEPTPGITGGCSYSGWSPDSGYNSDIAPYSTIAGRWGSGCKDNNDKRSSYKRNNDRDVYRPKLKRLCVDINADGYSCGAVWEIPDATGRNNGGICVCIKK